MYKHALLFGAAFCLPTAALANAWEDNFVRWLGPDDYIHSDGEVEKIPSSGSVDSDIGGMYRQGFVPIGYTLFDSGNDKTRDGERWGEELGATHMIVGVELKSSKTTAVPWSMPSTTTSNTNGNATVFGSGGSASGTFNSTTTTTGSKTTYLPITKNRFSKSAIYFAREPKFGAGIYTRQIAPEEMQMLGTRFAIAVRFVRDYSPAYYADILPGDIILRINDQPADPNIWWQEILDSEPDTVEILRSGERIKLPLTIPVEWRTQPRSAADEN